MNRFRVTGRVGADRKVIYINAPSADSAAREAINPGGYALDIVESVEPDERRDGPLAALDAAKPEEES